jgi:hypothetical protein
MASLLDKVIDAHGGMARWNQLEEVHAHLSQDGAIWALKGHAGQLADVFVTAKLHEQWVSHQPFGAPNLRSVSIGRPTGFEGPMKGAPSR